MHQRPFRRLDAAIRLPFRNLPPRNPMTCRNARSLRSSRGTYARIAPDGRDPPDRSSRRRPGPAGRTRTCPRSRSGQRPARIRQWWRRYGTKQRSLPILTLSEALPLWRRRPFVHDARNCSRDSVRRSVGNCSLSRSPANWLSVLLLLPGDRPQPEWPT